MVVHGCLSAVSELLCRSESRQNARSCGWSNFSRVKIEPQRLKWLHRRGLRLAGLYEAVLYLATTATFVFTFTGFLGRQWWVFDLTSHFRAQYVVLCALLGVIW